MKNRYPIYIVSKGRHHNMLTDRALGRLGLPFTVVCEEFEYELYADRCGHDNVIILPQKYLDEYDTCDEYGDTKSKGPGAARNFVWDHSTSLGHKWHWVLDDNLDDFHRLHHNVKCPVRTGATFAASEDFVEHFSNVVIGGMNYYSFCKSGDKVPPFKKNTRIYSCLLIRNDIPYRWRGRYNEDTDLSLRVLKDGLCTIQFNAFLCGKVTTQRMRGGNSKEFYDDEGTLAKSQMIVDLHPDVSRLAKKFNRWHHHVDYRPYADTPLIYDPNYIPIPRPDEYGMKLIEIDYNDKDDNPMKKD